MSVDSSYAREDEKLLEVESGGVSRAEFGAGTGLTWSSFSDSTVPSAVAAVSFWMVLVLMWLDSWLVQYCIVNWFGVPKQLYYATVRSQVDVGQLALHNELLSRRKAYKQPKIWDAFVEI
ncbi:unnamed protein product [Clonostachys solani]|uniref:Uncharacterized protein n=1 Tax=Clonostachys solani TaxID=160281 RepID=A0A9N9VY92_9HYPO|nr:unnamed protein product [Clonostachys solani]